MYKKIVKSLILQGYIILHLFLIHISYCLIQSKLYNNIFNSIHWEVIASFKFFNQDIHFLMKDYTSRHVHAYLWLHDCTIIFSYFNENYTQVKFLGSDLLPWVYTVKNKDAAHGQCDWWPFRVHVSVPLVKDPYEKIIHGLYMRPWIFSYSIETNKYFSILKLVGIEL